MASIQPNFNFAMQPAQVQAQRLKDLPDKTAYNEFVDATLQGNRFVDTSSDDAKSLSMMARSVARSIPDSDTDSKFKLYQAAFESAISGTLASVPGGPAAVMAKLVLDVLPSVAPGSQVSVASTALISIAQRSPQGEARDHAQFASEAATRASHSSLEVAKTIMVSGLGVIADLGATSGPAPSSSGLDPALEKAQLSFLNSYQGLDCKTQPGFFDSPTEMKGKTVAILARDQETGIVTEAVGRVSPKGVSNTALFTLEEGGRVFNSKDVIGLAESPYYLSAKSPDSFKNSLQRLKNEKDTQKAWMASKEEKGLACYPGGSFSGVDMTGRSVTVLMWDNDERTTTKEYSGLVTDTDFRSNALFKLNGGGQMLNSNDLVAVAFHDGRYNESGVTRR